MSRADRSSVAFSLVWSVLICALLASSGLPAFAQDAGEEADPFAGIEEMVVVGTGASSLLQSKEVSAIAFSAEHLEAIGASDLTDVATFTPNLEIRTPFAASNPTLFIRGVGLRDFNANSSSSVAVYNDEIYMNSPAGQLGQLFDTENIDVLRGPQTTTYARNASAGTIRVIARKPSGETGMNGSVTYGRFNQLNFEAAFENVIVPDMITMRTAARWNQRDGFTKNRCADSDYWNLPPQTQNNPAFPLQFLQSAVFTNCFSFQNTDPGNSPPFAGWVRNGRVAQPPPVKEWVNDTKNWAARTLIRFQHDFLDMDWVLNIHGGQNRGDSRSFQHVAVSQSDTQTKPVVATADTTGKYIDPDTRLPVRKNQLTRNARWRPTGDPYGGNPFEGDYNNINKEKIDLLGANLVGKMSFSNGDYLLTTATGYEFNERDTTIDLDGSPTVGLEPTLTNTAYQLTQELRLDFDDGGAFRWQIAGMYLYETLESANRFAVNVNIGESSQDYTFFTRYAAGWAKFEWEPAETFSLKGGARLNYEDKEINLETQQFDITFGTGLRTAKTCPLGSFADRQKTIPGCASNGGIVSRGSTIPPAAASAAAREYGWAGDLIATWSPATDVSLYLRYARGWKGPHINGGINNANVVNSLESDLSDLARPVSPEIIDSLEFGMKAEFWANRIRWNWAVFYYDYQNIQVFRIRNTGVVPVQELINGDDADVLGVEMEIDVKPFEGWAHPLFEGIWARFTFAWLQTKYTDFVTIDKVSTQSGDTVVVRRIPTVYTGNQLVNAPKFSFIGFVTWPVGGEWGLLIPRVDWSYKTKVYFGPSNAGLASQDSLWIVNARLIYKSPSETFEIQGWIANVTDQHYTVDAFNLSKVRGAILHAVGDPRTYGLTLKVNF